MAFDRRRVLATAGAAVTSSFPGLVHARSSVHEEQDMRPAHPDPRLHGYAMPHESAPHERTFMQWPMLARVYGRGELRRVRRTIAAIADAISSFEPVVLLASGAAAAEARSATGSGVEVWDVPTDDLWCRDSGPTFVKDGTGNLAVAHIRFNGWGGRQSHRNDARIAAAVAERLGLPLLETGLVGEQGGVEHDGAGTLLAHASSWVNANRSRDSREAIGKGLMTALGGRRIIWTPGLIGKDITDYHVDSLARFVAPGRVLIQLPRTIDRDDPYSVAAYETYERLKSDVDASGRRLDLVVLPEPRDIRSRQADFVASYVNYYVCNGAVICAQFGDPKADGEAKAILASLHPSREIVMLDVDPLGEAGGGIHCATQQQPKS